MDLAKKNSLFTTRFQASVNSEADKNGLNCVTEMKIFWANILLAPQMKPSHQQNTRDPPYAPQYAKGSSCWPLLPLMRRLPPRSRENFGSFLSCIPPPLRWKTHAMPSPAPALHLYTWPIQKLAAIGPFITSKGKSHQQNKSSYPSLCQHPPRLTDGMSSPTP